MNSKSSLDTFFPIDPVSEELLKSIPKKVYFWLEGLGVDMTEPGLYHKLNWHFTEDTSSISYGDHTEEQFTTLWWEGTVDNPTNLCGSDKQLERIIDNMDFFTQLEEDIYSTLELFEEERDR